MEGWAVLLGFKSSGASQEEAAAGTHTPLWKAVGRFSQTQIHLLCDLVVQSLGIYSK